MHKRKESEMEQSRTPARGPARYMIPTHLNVEDKIINFNGFGVTMRQAFLLLVGWSTAFNLWRQLDGLSGYGVIGLVLRIGISLLPGLLSLVLALSTVAGRPLEAWLLVVLRYYSLPKVYLWNSLASKEAFPAPDQSGQQKRTKRHKVPFEFEDEQE